MEQQTRDISCLDGRSDGNPRDEAMSFLMRLASGEATVQDTEALRRWREESPEHRQAFAEAKLLWEALGPAAEDVLQRGGAFNEAQQAAAFGLRVGRRALIGGALAASVAAVGYVSARPPFGLWPSLEEIRADYRTATGERQQVALADDVSLLLNTRTSIDIGSGSSGSRVIELISGEALVNANAPDLIDIRAADGRVMAKTARFSVRRDSAIVRVTCLDGAVSVVCRDRSATVPSGQQISYDGAGLRDPAPVDLAIATAWEHGQLIFRHELFSRVIDEVNRYRRGRIILLNEQLGERDVVATFHLDRLDEAVMYLAQTFNAHVRHLPGGIVALS